MLWHLPDSHFNEKVRWALDVKRLAHGRRAPLVGLHLLVAAWLTPGYRTLPILVVDGRAIRDSPNIIAELERMRPEPPLLPADRAGRARARELEQAFDEGFAPFIRRIALFELLRDPALVVEATAPHAGAPTRRALAASLPALRRLLFANYGIDAASVAEAHGRTAAALDRIESELGTGDYLVGERFTAADLTAAAMLGPLLRPSGYPAPPLPWLPPALERLRDDVAQRRAGRWAYEMYRRHRT